PPSPITPEFFGAYVLISTSLGVECQGGRQKRDRTTGPPPDSVPAWYERTQVMREAPPERRARPSTRTASATRASSPVSPTRRSPCQTCVLPLRTARRPVSSATDRYTLTASAPGAAAPTTYPLLPVPGPRSVSAQPTRALIGNSAYVHATE